MTSQNPGERERLIDRGARILYLHSSPPITRAEARAKAEAIADEVDDVLAALEDGSASATLEGES